jgi:hypothetical protein
LLSLVVKQNRARFCGQIALERTFRTSQKGGCQTLARYSPAMNLPLMKHPRRNYWYALAATALLMPVWFLSPLGDYVTRLATQVNPELAGWAWPITGLTTFWLLRLSLFLQRKRLPSTVATDRSPGVDHSGVS